MRIKCMRTTQVRFSRARPSRTEMVAFDNMHDRPIKGTTGWQQYEVVLDIPRDSTGISFWILLDGTGITGTGERKIPDMPVNL